jgi:plastocyanin
MQAKVLLGASAVVSLALSSPALAGSIKGTVKLPKASEAERTVVYLESVPEGSFETSGKVVRLSQKGANFAPAVLPVLRGSQVDMSNDDWVSHNAFSKSAVKAFDLGIYGQDVKKTVTFEKVGVVDVFCSIHPRMNAVILVLQNPYFVRPTRDGSFSLDNVPAGTYRIKVYRPGEPASPGVNVVVPASGTVEAQL